MTLETKTLQLSDELPLTLTEGGHGRPVLVLHGGGGPFTTASLTAHLAETMHVLAPTHPGWNGTPRPSWFAGADDLALAYLQLLQARDLHDVLVVGSSLGGWLAAEMAMRDQGQRIGSVVLINATGVQVEGESIRDVFTLTPRELAEFAFHDAAKFYVDPASLPPPAQAAQKANREALRAFADASSMHDPKLLRRLARVRTPALVLWGESDRIVTATYGRAFARAFGNGRFEAIAQAGHLPQLEQPASTFARIDAFAQETQRSSSASIRARG